MNNQKAIDDFRHGVSGVWLEILLSGAKGGELSIRLRDGLKLIDKLALRLGAGITTRTNDQRRNASKETMSQKQGQSPRPVSRKIDPELQCMARIDRLLSDLPESAMIPRVLRWIASKYFDESVPEEVQAKELPVQDVDD